MDTLQQMFPDLDAAVLQATLEAHDHQLEATVEYLLSQTAASQPSAARLRQEEDDLRLAQRIAAEQDAALQSSAPAATPASTGLDPVPGMPSLADVGQAIRPIMSGIQHAGRAAAEGVQQLYNDIVSGQPAASSSRRHTDDTVVVSDNLGSPGGSRPAPRHRRPPPRTAGNATGKKDA